MILGLHGSIRRGYLGALDEARAHGVRAVQTFCYNRHEDPSDEVLHAFRDAREGSSIGHHAVHARYLPALASSDADARARSVELLTRELRLSTALGADAFILHAGAYSPGAERAEGAALFTRSVREAWDAGDFTLRVLIENVPGGGRRLGGPLEEVAGMLEELDGAGIPCGACLDTAHAYGQGYDLRDPEGARAFAERAAAVFGAAAVRAFHLNDTTSTLGSHRENHEHWGEGEIGLGGVRELLRDARFEAALGIIETPKGPGFDHKNLERLRALF